jgi:hypothetical protein
MFHPQCTPSHQWTIHLKPQPTPTFASPHPLTHMRYSTLLMAVSCPQSRSAQIRLRKVTLGMDMYSFGSMESTVKQISRYVNLLLAHHLCHDASSQHWTDGHWWGGSRSHNVSVPFFYASTSCSSQHGQGFLIYEEKEGNLPLTKVTYTAHQNTMDDGGCLWHLSKKTISPCKFSSNSSPPQLPIIPPPKLRCLTWC